MPTPTSTIHIRPLELKDFTFVRELAAKQPNFTIPPPYVLWLLMKIKGSICLIAESESHDPLGYLLAVPVSDPPDSLFVWQVATVGDRRNLSAITGLLTALRQSIDSLKIERLVFTALKDSPTFRAIRRDAFRIFQSKPIFISALPEIVAPDESEFEIELQ